MYDTLTSQFNDALTREGKTITSADGVTSCTCLFRKNSDKNSSDNRLTIFYPAADTITQGQLLKFNGNYFIAVNQETNENEIYKKSDLLEVNTEIHTISSGYELFIRAYAEDMTSVGVTGDSKISVVGGNISFITQDDSNSRKLAIDAVFTALGGTWKIINIYYKDGLCYIFTERAANSTTTPVYGISINGSDNCKEGESITLSASTTVTDNSVTTTILNPTITWTSSDQSVATVSSSGTVQSITSGSVTITAVWLEHGVTATKAITVNKNVTYAAAITTSATSIYTGTNRTWNGQFTDSNGTVVPLTAVWSLTLGDATQTGHISITASTDTSVTIAASDYDDMIGTTFNINLADSNNLCSTSKTISIE